MRESLFLPFLFLIFAMISLTVLQSIAPTLVLFQAIYFVASAGLFFFISQISFDTWKSIHWLTYSACIALLVIVLIIGVARKGATRWIPIGPFNLQPSQIAHPMTLLTLSIVFSKKSIKKPKNLVMFSCISILPWFLIVIEPNLGTSLILLAGIGAIFLQTDIPLKTIGGMLGIGLILAVLGWQFFLQPYQKQRILSFAQPEKYEEANYNAIQSMIAVGSGRVLGRGLGHGIQSQLRFLPERQTDFIFASLAEELGFIGSAFVLSLYTALLLFLSHFLLMMKNHMFSLLLSGIIISFLLQLFVNIGMNTGIMPITGITLPFISYGGSSLLSFSITFGLIQRIIIESRAKDVFEIR